LLAFVHFSSENEDFRDAGFVSYQQLLAVMAPTSSRAASFLGGIAAQRPHRVMMKGPGLDLEPCPARCLLSPFTCRC